MTTQTKLTLDRVDQFSELLGPTKIRPTLLENKPVSANILIVDTNGISIRIGHLEGHLLLNGQSPEGFVNFGTLFYGEGVKTNSIATEPGDFVVYPSGLEHETVYRSEAGYLIVAFKNDALLGMSEVEGVHLSRNALTKARIYKLPRKKAAALRQNIQRISWELSFNPGIMEHPHALRGLTDDLVRLYSRALADTTVGQSEKCTNLRSETSVATQARDWILHRVGTKFSIEDLSVGVNLSLRQLYRIFQTELGVSPAQFVKFHNMTLARADFIQARPCESTVTEIAYKWGFWELGRFALNYRKAFGELPSETLRK